MQNPARVQYWARSTLAAALTTLLTALALVISCAPNGAQNSGNAGPGQQKPGDDVARQAAGLAVADARGVGIPGARVLIGLRQGVPFPDNFVLSGADGAITAPDAWTTPQPVTIDAPGFVRATYYARTPASGPMRLRPLPAAQRLLLQGGTSGYGTLTDDGYAHVGLVFPALARAEMGTVQVSSFISPEMDTITVAGQSADLPSNVSIPRQTLRYLFMNVTLDKLNYRAFLDRAGGYRMVAAHARFKFSDGVSAIQGGKPFLELVDLLDFREAALTDVNVGIGGARADLSVAGIPFGAKAPYTSPRFDSRYKALALALNQVGDAFYPSDVKRIASGATKQLSVPTAATTRYALYLLQPANAPTTGAAADQMSLVISSALQTTASEFLAIPAPPSLRGGSITSQTLVTQPPAAPAGTMPGATYAALSVVQQSASGKFKVERKIGRWDLYSEGWATSLDLPAWPLTDPAPTGPQRWETTFAAFPAGAAPLAGPQAFEKASHAAKSALDL